MSENAREEKLRAAWARAKFILEPRYTPTKFLGMDKMSVVVTAVHQTLGTEVAIKLLDENLLTDDEAKARFVREAKIAASIKHPNIVPVRDVNDQEGYIVMDRIHSVSLREKIRKSKHLEASKVIALARVILSALNATHKEGVIHRDIKPANILMEPNGHI